MSAITKFACATLLAVSSLRGTSLSWPTSADQIPEANKIPVSTITSLVNSVLGSVPQYYAITMRVVEFRFAHLEAAQRIDLIAIIDSSGRGVNEGFIAIWQEPPGYKYAILTDLPVGVIGRTVVDLDGDGLCEVIAGTAPGGYQGVNTDPLLWFGVYQLRAGKWVDVSDSYPSLFGHELWFQPALVLALAVANETGDKELPALRKAQASFVEFKYDRHVFKRSGMDLQAALEWSRSLDWRIQLLAIDTFADIQDASSIAALKELAGSKSSEVSFAAKGVLAGLGIQK